MDTRSVTASVILAVGIAGGFALLGSNISSGIESFVNRDRIVTVKGLSERQVKADRVIWPVGFRELGDDLQDVYGRIEKRKDQVVAFLKEAGLTDAEIEVASPQVTDAQAEMYANQKKPLPLLDDADGDGIKRQGGPCARPSGAPKRPHQSRRDACG